MRMSEAEMGKQLLITPDVLLKIDADLWEDGGDRFFFDYDSYEIRSKDEINEFSYSIPLVHVPQVAVMKAFIADLNNRKISTVFNDLSDKEIWSKFWIFFDDDGVNSSRWHEYEQKYRIDLITAWCEENGISYIWSE